MQKSPEYEDENRTDYYWGPTMDAYEEFREELQDALHHLHDPDYSAPATLAAVLMGESPVNTASIQFAIIQAIQQLAASPDTSSSAFTRLNYELLVHRFIDNRTQAGTAERLHTTERNIRRKQPVAIHMLARFLWERHTQARSSAIDDMPTSKEDTQSASSPSRKWESQARQELNSLLQSDPTQIASVGDVLRSAVDLDKVLAGEYGVSLVIGEIPEHLTAAAPPTALRQILIMVISQMSRRNRSRRIYLDAWEETGFAVIRLHGERGANEPVDLELAAGLLRLLGGSLVSATSEDGIELILRVPAIGKVNVVVIDDNQDFVHFCARCTRGTRFGIVQPKDWTIEAIQEAQADVILLDIMLPNLDGWELLQALRRDPATAEIPVIVCSIVGEEALASLFGAVAYLPKPVNHRKLLATLERIVS
jgi:CheY-like chemotaxis protein